MAPNVLKPSVALLAKLGSILVHMQEATSLDGHGYDWIALRQLLADPEVAEWLGRNLWGLPATAVSRSK